MNFGNLDKYNTDYDVLPDEWKPQAHIYYNSRLQGNEIDDKLPKIDQRPASIGGVV